MFKLWQLVQNENMKIYRRPGTWVMFGILISLLVIVGIFTKFIIEDPVHASWQEWFTSQKICRCKQLLMRNQCQLLF
ncbi:hypothetical protein KHA80_20905 [Anaerobacillus sp. HL2]|nr:hypothetical protein KHA80_20905 [Anaerobacillus sp. HL2]